MRRFTRRARTRRIAVWLTAGLGAVVLALILVAVFSPILALRHVVVEGTSRVDAAVVTERLEEQLGTPLALLDAAKIDEALAAFPVIRSYTTEMVPPDTIIVRIVEREPIASVAEPSGGYRYVDPVGVTVQLSGERLPGVPLIVDSGVELPNDAFDAAVEVLLAMSEELRAQVDTIRAASRDDVWLTMSGVSQAVKWGSADDSEVKAARLAWLQQQFAGQAGTFDVSAPSMAVFRPA